MVWVIAFGELFFGDLWCVVWGYGGMRTHFSLLNPKMAATRGWDENSEYLQPEGVRKFVCEALISKEFHR